MPRSSPPTILVGDSDIARWPKEWLPNGTTFVSGHSGATLCEILPHMETTTIAPSSIIIACAGENDIDSVPLWESETALRELAKKCTANGSYLLFLGPKLEPWLQDDFTSRKKYFNMSKSFGRALSQETRAIFIDCLIMFCQDKDKPGAVFKAKPDPIYFDTDQLHLSDAGYQVWKQVVDQEVERILSATF